MSYSRSQSAGISTPASLGNSCKKNPSRHQGRLSFDAPREPGSFNDDGLVRATIAATIKACARSREQIADTMSELLGVRVTAKMLNSYSSDAMQPNRFPAAWDRAFCEATGSDDLLCCRVRLAGLLVINRSEADLLELGREFLRQKRASENVLLIEKRLQGIDL